MAGFPPTSKKLPLNTIYSCSNYKDSEDSSVEKADPAAQVIPLT